jgi:hypothetical protein
MRIHNGEFNLDPWYFILGADILTLAGLSLLVIGFLRLALKNNTVLYFLLAVFVASVSPLLNQPITSGRTFSYAIAFLWGTTEWSYFPLFPWFSYVLAGYAFSLFIQQTPVAKKIDIKNNFIYFIPLWIGIIMTVPYAAGIAHTLYGTGGYYHHGFLFFAWTLLFMISYLVAMKLIEIYYGDQVIVRSIKWIGKEVTVLYVIQWLIIGNIATIVYRSQDLFRITAWLGVVTIATILIGLLFVKIRSLLY